MHRVPAQREPRRALGRRLGAYTAIGLLIGVIVVTRPAYAAPIALGASDAEPSSSDTEASLPAFSNVLPSSGETDDATLPLAAPNTAASMVAEPGDTPPRAAGGKVGASVEARAPQQPPVPGRPMRDVAPAAGVPRPALPFAFMDDEMVAGEADWEHEIKEALRPIYDDLSASGVIDAVQGFRSYLAMLGVYLSSEQAPTSDYRPPSGRVAEPRIGTTEVGWETQTGRTDALMLGKSEAQIEKERLTAAMLINEWLTGALPWIYGAAGLAIVWQVVKFTFAFVRSRSPRTHRRTTKRRHRSADSARTRARS